MLKKIFFLALSILRGVCLYVFLVVVFQVTDVFTQPEAGEIFHPITQTGFYIAITAALLTVLISYHLLLREKKPAARPQLDIPTKTIRHVAQRVLPWAAMAAGTALVLYGGVMFLQRKSQQPYMYADGTVDSIRTSTETPGYCRYSLEYSFQGKPHTASLLVDEHLLSVSDKCTHIKGDVIRFAFTTTDFNQGTSIEEAKSSGNPYKYLAIGLFCILGGSLWLQYNYKKQANL